MRPVAHILLVNVDPILYSTLIQPVRRNQLQIPAMLIPGEIAMASAATSRMTANDYAVLRRRAPRSRGADVQP
jgi:hypothetical protein